MVSRRKHAGSEWWICENGIGKGIGRGLVGDVYGDWSEIGRRLVESLVSDGGPADGGEAGEPEYPTGSSAERPAGDCDDDGEGR